MNNAHVHASIAHPVQPEFQSYGYMQQRCTGDFVEVSELCPINVGKCLQLCYFDSSGEEPLEVSSHLSLAPSSVSRVVTHKTTNPNILQMRLSKLCGMARAQFDVVKIVIACRTDFLKKGEVYNVLAVGSKSPYESCKAIQFLRTELEKEVQVMPQLHCTEPELNAYEVVFNSNILQ